MKILTPHFEIKITQRSKGQSAVSGVAYHSGDKLFFEYYQKNKEHRNKHSIVYTEIMIPSYTPPEYVDHEALWNAVEVAEAQWNLSTCYAICVGIVKRSTRRAVSTNGEGTL